MMPKLINRTDQPIEASTGHVIPAHGTLGISDSTLARLSVEPYIAMKVRKGELGIEYPQPEAEPDEVTRSVIAKANRSKLLQTIADHSDYDADDFKGVTVEDKDGEDGLRTIAARLVFGD